ncbi:MAG: Bro-N domain-containing protein [Candidatus Omnitrophota bacterium]|nr:Bro-N domain-containing protein [Candidatus Omnitrophota bacterium]
METKIAVFKGKRVRRILRNNEWWFSVADVVEVLTDSSDPRQYIKKMRQRDPQIDANWGTICTPLELQAPDGKMRETNCANTEGLFRIIQSIPSSKAEPFKRWLAKVGYERVQEIENPELAMERMRAIYEKKGYPKEWIEKRVRGIAVRQSLTKEWDARGAATDLEYAILTNDIMESAFGLKVDDYKKLKKLERENLRDHMNDIELILTMLGEATTTKITKDRDSKGMPQLRKDAQDGGGVAGRTRKDIETQSGTPVVSGDNFLGLKKRGKLK